MQQGTTAKLNLGTSHASLTKDTLGGLLRSVAKPAEPGIFADAFLDARVKPGELSAETINLANSIMLHPHVPERPHQLYEVYDVLLEYPGISTNIEGLSELGIQVELKKIIEWKRFVDIFVSIDSEKSRLFISHIKAQKEKELDANIPDVLKMYISTFGLERTEEIMILMKNELHSHIGELAQQHAEAKVSKLAVALEKVYFDLGRLEKKAKQFGLNPEDILATD